MSPKRIVSLGGGRGESIETSNSEAENVGKTTVAEFFVKTHGWKRISFAAPLKKHCVSSGLLTEDDINNKTRILPSGKTVRRVLQDEGMKGRETGRWLREMKEALDGCSENVIIDDCRFPDEQELLRQYNTVLIKIVRNLEKSNDTHPSCTQKLEYDHYVMNDSTLENLFSKVYEYVEKNNS